jgi:Flp pilus assembly protein TadD
MILAVALLVTSPSVRAQAPSAESASRVLVMPFVAATERPPGEWLGEGAAVMLTDVFLALGLPAMERDERMQALELLRVPSRFPLSYASVMRVGQSVGASQVVVGTYELERNRLTVRARTILLDSGIIQPEIVEEGPVESLFAIYGRVAVRLMPGAEVSRDTPGALHPPILAFEQFVKGVLAEAPDAQLALLREALRVHPSFDAARVALWSVHASLGDHDAALTVVQGTAAGDTPSRRARFLASVSMVQLERYADAYDVLVQLNAESPDATLLNNLGVVQLRRADPSGGGRAVSYFGEAARLDGVDSFFNLGYAYWLDGDPEPAVYWLREAVRRDPGDDAAHYVLGVALDRLGRTPEAERERELARRLSSTYEEWERGAPGASAVLSGLERLRLDLGLPSALRIENVIEAVSQHDREQLALFHRDAGRVAFENERDAAAVAELRRAVYLAPYDHEAHLLLGRVYLRSGRLSDALRSLTISIWSTDTVAARLMLARAYAEAGSPGRARAELETVLEREPTNVQAREILGQLARDD